MSYELVDTYYDEAVSGADPIEVRPGFSALLDRIERNGVRVVVVEDPPGSLVSWQFRRPVTT